MGSATPQGNHQAHRNLPDETQPCVLRRVRRNRHHARWLCTLRKRECEMTAAQYATLEANRTDDAVELETVNHELTLWFMAHPGCRDEIDEYKQAQDELDIIAGLDDELAAH